MFSFCVFEEFVIFKTFLQKKCIVKIKFKQIEIIYKYSGVRQEKMEIKREIRLGTRAGRGSVS